MPASEMIGIDETAVDISEPVVGVKFKVFANKCNHAIRLAFRHQYRQPVHAFRIEFPSALRLLSAFLFPAHDMEVVGKPVMCLQFDSGERLCNLAPRRANHNRNLSLFVHRLAGIRRS
jgi:hypothetical protein